MTAKFRKKGRVGTPKGVPGLKCVPLVAFNYVQVIDDLKARDFGYSARQAAEGKKGPKRPHQRRKTGNLASAREGAWEKRAID